MTLDLWGHVGYMLLFLGQVAVTRKKAWGFGLRWAGEVIWLTLGVQMGMSSIWVWGLFGLAVEAYGWWSWTHGARRVRTDALE
jgi:hypothetical protein